MQQSVSTVPPPPLDTSERRASRRHWWVWVGVMIVAGGGAYVFFPRVMRGQAATVAPAQNSASTAIENNRAVPVVTASARLGNMGVYLSGLGTVTPLNTVTIRSRVDGQLVDVAFTEGQTVQQGDLLARIDSRPYEVQLTQAEGQKAKDEATLKNAQLDLVRYQDLLAKGLVPKQQADTQVATVNQAMGAVQSDQGQIDSAKLNLVYSRITAPITGRVGLRLVDPGNIVHATDTGGLVVITQIDPISVVFTIPEDALPQLTRQMQNGAKLPVEVYDREAKTRLATGTLLTIDNQIDQTTGTVKVKTLFQNPAGALFPNQFVNARLLVDTVHNTVIVPSAAIQRSPQATFVYVVKPDKSVEMRTVDVGLSDGDDTAVKRGIAAGDIVVTDGVDKLQQGTKVATR